MKLVNALRLILFWVPIILLLNPNYMFDPALEFLFNLGYWKIFWICTFYVVAFNLMDDLYNDLKHQKRFHDDGI